MIWFILIVLLTISLCFLSYRKGALRELEKINKSLNNYLESHKSMEELFYPGIEVAKHIIDQLKDQW